MNLALKDFRSQAHGAAPECHFLVLRCRCLPYAALRQAMSHRCFFRLQMARSTTFLPRTRSEPRS
eukprot:9057925-Alexandrium_andersonii.AAC.1